MLHSDKLKTFESLQSDISSINCVLLNFFYDEIL